MGQGQRRRPGGIWGCLAGILEYGSEVEYELLCLGLRLRDLGSDDLTWHDLSVILRHPTKGGPLHRAVFGGDAKWDDAQTQLLAQIVDVLAVGNWQRQGDSHAPRPEPIPRPGVEGYVRVTGSAEDEDAYTIAEIDNLPNTPSG